MRIRIEDGTSEVPALPYDGTLCNNIVVKNCTFNNLISGIGNHALIDNRGVNFEISNNKFNNIKVGNIIKIFGRVEKRYDKYQVIINNISILE